MEDPDYKSSSEMVPGTEEMVEPSWRPFYWFVGSFVALFLLGELIVDFGLEVAEFLWVLIEKVWLVLIEAPEEWLEDRLADYLKQHFPHEAERYSEIATAMGLTPLKLVLVFFFGRYLYRQVRMNLWPRIVAGVRRQVRQVHLAWNILSLPQKIFATLVFLVLLVILI